MQKTWTAFWAAASLMATLHAWPGQVATDSSLGHPARTLSGPLYSIGADLGVQRGGNLFHSFSSFSLNQGDVATFTADHPAAPVRNVILRVTGGATSSIDGTLRSNIADANFLM